MAIKWMLLLHYTETCQHISRPKNYASMSSIAVLRKSKLNIYEVQQNTSICYALYKGHDEISKLLKLGTFQLYRALNAKSLIEFYFRVYSVT